MASSGQVQPSGFYYFRAAPYPWMLTSPDLRWSLACREDQHWAIGRMEGTTH